MTYAPNIGAIARPSNIGSKRITTAPTTTVPAVSRYADLCLLRRPDARASSLCDLLFGFKRLRLAKVGMSGEEVKATSRAELMALPEVDEALNEAQTQAVAYRKALLRRHGSVLKLRAYALVAVGFARLVVRPVP